MYEYWTFGNKNPKFDHDEQRLRRRVALRCGVARLRYSEPEGWPFWPFGLAAARQHFAVVKCYAAVKVLFAAAKGPDFCLVFLLFALLRFLPKILKTTKKNMGITPNNILILS